MRQRAILIWLLFAIAMFLLLLLCAAGIWFILGPYGPPLPGQQAAPAATMAPDPPAMTVTPTRDSPPPDSPTATPPAPSPTVEPVPSPSPYPGLTRPATAAPTVRPTTATPLARPTTPPPTTAVPTAPPTTAAPTPQASDGSETARRLAEAQVAPRDPVELASRLQHGGAPLPRTVTPDPEPHFVGREDHFWLADPGLNTYREITATLLAITEHLYMYVENGVRVDQRALEAAARTFEEEIYPTTRAAFGSEWKPGVDGDPHITILHARFQGAAGYFSSLNQVPREVNPYSNQREMFCMNADALTINSAAYLSTLAHEFQHMIHWHQDPQSSAWFDEGMAQMAEQINGFDPGRWAWRFLSDTDVQLTTWTDEPGESLAHYAASYLWFRYFTDRLGGTTVLSNLLDPEVDEITAIERALRQAGYTPVVTAPRLFDAFFADWAIANYLDDSRVGDGRYTYARGFRPGALWPGEHVYDLPWSTAATVQPYATDYIAVASSAEGALRIVFAGEQTLPLLATTPHSGQYFWYSHRGDQANMTLTRAFDLRGVSQATLRYWLWYDIEVDYDYAYAEVSTDAGRSWTILPGQYTTDTNPNGNNLGHGYTGLSGGGRTPRWIQESIDLSAYTGREVLIRFEYITDDAYNAPGLALDDIEIPEIGFFDDAETDAGWAAQGFVWVDNTVPLHYVVQVVTKTPRGLLAVQQLALDGNRRGEITLPGYGGAIDRVTLVISAVAPVTTEPAAYQVWITLE